jgi:hypothetical protein
LHQYGQGVEQDFERAMTLYKRAAGGGLAEAYNSAGLLYEAGGGDKILKDEKEAAVWYRGAADRNHGWALVTLGNLYADGRGVAKDEAKAVELYREAADLGAIGGFVNLGFMYEGGHGVQQDVREALRLYLIAAEKGNAVAQYNVGSAYYHGRGAPQDMRKAYAWYDKSAQQGDEKAIARRDEIRRAWALDIEALSSRPNPVAPGERATFTVKYSPPASDLGVPVTEQWTLVFNDAPVTRPFERRFDVTKSATSHDFEIPIPFEAQAGVYKLKLHSASPAEFAESQILFEVAR